jgi:biotin carboxylase
VVDFSDIDRVAAVARAQAVEGILAVCTDRAVVPAASVAARLGLPGIGADVARAMTHKPTMRRRLAEAGIPQPAFAALTARDSGRGGVPLPAVLKPADSGGQRGLFLIERDVELAERLPATLAFSVGGEAMLEEYVDGTELNALIAVRGGVPTLLTLSDRLRHGGPGFGVGWIHSFPSSLPADVLARVAEVALEAVRALGLQDGIAFPQLIATADGRVVVVEVAARIAAGQMADLVRHGTGIELYQIAIAQSLGLDVPDELVRPRFIRPVAIRFLTASPGVLPVGTVQSIEGLERMRNAPGVLDAGLYFDVGTTIQPLQADIDRRGYVIASGDSPAEALGLANAAATKLRVRVGEKTARSVDILAVALVAALIAATAAAFAVTERAKLTTALVAGTRIDKTFSPVCDCSHDVAHIAFRLLRPARVIVSMVDASTKQAVAIFHSSRAVKGWLHLRWTGRGRSERPYADGAYSPQVSFPALHRTLRLPSTVELDTGRPPVERSQARAMRFSVVVTYRFGERAQAELFVDGRRTVLTRFAPVAGHLRWGDRRVRPGTYRLALEAIDPAGNRSRQTSLGRLVVGRRHDAIIGRERA